MPVDLYCSRGDVTRRLPPGALTSPSALTVSATSASDAIVYDGHGLETGDLVTVRASDATGSALPAPLVVDTTYYAIRVSNSKFKLATSAVNAAAGTAIDFSTSGTNVVVIREPDFDTAIEEVSRWADDYLPGHLVPLDTPLGADLAHLRAAVADVVAANMLNFDGKASDIVAARKADAKTLFERHASGLPVRGESVTASANLAIVASSTTDSRGWGSGSLP